MTFSLDALLESYRVVATTEREPAIDWIIERQAVKVHKTSGIVNYADETMGDPRYPFNLLCCVITLSLETMKIVRALPSMEIRALGS